MGIWDNLYFPFDDRELLIKSLRDALNTLGYTAFNPFGLLPGKSYPQAVRLFVAPAGAGWLRIIGTPDSALLPTLSQLGMTLHVSLRGTDAQILVYQDGDVADIAALAPYMRNGRSIEDLRSALDATYIPTNSPNAAPKVMAVPLDALPEDIRTMAGEVDLSQAEGMFKRISGNLLKKAGGGDGQSAAGLLGEQDGPQWGSAGGQRISALMACLNVPDEWRKPDFVALRDAYQLHERKRRKPDAADYPGDIEAMALVPDALDYAPVYAGKG